MLECPYDRSPMHSIPLAAGIEYVCARCEGLWLPGRLVHAFIGPTSLERIRDVAASRLLRCPNDGERLHALLHHGVEIDICTQCAGVWLDADERARIQDAHAGAAPANTARDPSTSTFDTQHFSPPLFDHHSSQASSSDSDHVEHEAGADVDADADIDADFDLDAVPDDVGPLEGLFEFIGEAFSALDAL